jgi:hypothetical protein
MVFVETQIPDEEINSPAERRAWAEDFYVHYYNEPRTFTDVSTLQYGSDPASMDGSPYNIKTEFADQTATVAGTFKNGRVPIDTIIIGDCSAFGFDLTFKDGDRSIPIHIDNVVPIPKETPNIITLDGAYITDDNGKNIVAEQLDERYVSVIGRRLSFGQRIRGSLDRGLFIAHFPLLYADAFSIIFYSESTTLVSIAYLYMGLKTGVTRPATLEYGVELQSKAEISKNLLVSGLKEKSYRTLTATFPVLSNRVRNVLEEYMNKVQTVEPHVIEPVGNQEAGYMPPIYGVLMQQGLKNEKKPDSRWLWKNNSLKWRETN